MATLTLCLSLLGSSLDPSQTVAFLGIQGEGAVEETATTLLTEILLTELQRHHPKVIGGSDMASMLQFDATRTDLGCEDTSCLAEVGMALGARYLVAATLGRLGDRFVFALKLIDTEEVTVVNRVFRTGPFDEDALIEAVRPTVEELLGGGGGAGEKSPAAATTKGTSPASPPGHPSPGASPPEAVPATAPPLLRVESSPYPRWGWAGLGVGALSLAAGATLGYLARRDAKELATLEPTSTQELERYEDLRRRGSRNALLADIGLALGTLGLGAGLAAALLPASGGGAGGVKLVLGPRHVGLVLSLDR